MFGAPVWNYLKAKYTTFPITKNRLLVVEGLLRRSVDSYQCDDIGHIKRTEQKGGIGSTIFTSVEKRRGGGEEYKEKKLGFFGIANLREVELLVTQFKDQREK